MRSVAPGHRQVEARPPATLNTSCAALDWCVCWMHTTTMTDKRGKGHDPSARALARWETEGGAPRNGRNPQRPRDPNQLAKLIVDMATGEALRETKLEDGKNPAALALGRLGGLRDGSRAPIAADVRHFNASPSVKLIVAMLFFAALRSIWRR